MYELKGRWCATAALTVLAGVLHGCGGGGGGSGGLPGSPSERATGLGNAIADTSDDVPYARAGPLYDVIRSAADRVTVLVAPDFDGESEYAPTREDVPNVGSGWNGLVLKKAGDGVTEYVTFLTDIEEPTDEPFRSVYGKEEQDDVFGGPDGTARIDSRLLRSGDFPPASASYSYGPEDRDRQFRGTFDGVPGLFGCVSANVVCTLTADARGVLRQGAGDQWEFVADAPNAAMVKVADPDFLYFGWWLEEPRNAAPRGGYAYRFATLSGGSQPFEPATTMAAVTGTATFEGPAAGRYATRTSAVAAVQAGTFTADAALEADFDAAGEGTLEGVISGFHDQDGNALDWAITLASESIRSGIVVDGDTTGQVQANVPGDGLWSASFFGNGRDDGHPGSAAGAFVFSAPGSGPRVDLAGAFAARNTSPDE